MKQILLYILGIFQIGCEILVIETLLLIIFLQREAVLKEGQMLPLFLVCNTPEHTVTHRDTNPRPRHRLQTGRPSAAPATQNKPRNRPATQTTDGPPKCCPCHAKRTRERARTHHNTNARRQHRLQTDRPSAAPARQNGPRNRHTVTQTPAGDRPQTDRPIASPRHAKQAP